MSAYRYIVIVSADTQECADELMGHVTECIPGNVLRLQSTASTTCRICSEQIVYQSEWVHVHSNAPHCGCGDGSMAYPKHTLKESAS